LGSLNCIRIWHDNSGRGASESWFLKYLIVRDLQSMQKFHFIAQKWFAVEKDDGKVSLSPDYVFSIALRTRSSVFCQLQANWRNMS
jgi:hypothetical protein